MNRSTPSPQKIFNLFAFVVMATVLLIFPRISKAVDNPSSNASGNPERGKALFDKRCTGCHSLDQDREGPRLRNVYGRRGGTVSTFKYSDALKAAHPVWDDVSLDKWLSDPDSLVPDNDMAFHVPKADERADIIRFLRVSSGK